MKVLGVFLALGLIAAAVVAVSLTASTTQAQSPDNAYDNPQPCGPGAETPFQPEPHEITTGHFALFDGYWEWLVQDDDDENVGILHTNLCPPLVVKTMGAGEGERTEEGEEEEQTEAETTTVISLIDSGIDIDEAIIHVLDDHKVTVVEGNPEDSDARELPASRYPELIDDDHISAGDRVWWLRLDDPDTEGVDEASDLTLGFSTMRFDGQYWAAPDGGQPFRFMFELERDPGIDPNDHPHFFAYRKPRTEKEMEENKMVLVWSSAGADTREMTMEAGQLEDLEWVFTRPGTYEIWVHLQGWVRQPYNAPEDADADWRPISEYETETSEVKRYVIQVGSKLDEVEPPQFGVIRSVAENSPAWTEVGDPISVFGAEVDNLEYRLSGEGHDQFALVPATYPRSVQIVVADGARLDYEGQAVYALTLGVTDNVDHESNPDPSLDDTLEIRILLEDVPTSATIQVDNPNPVVGETVTFTAVVTDFGEGQDVSYNFSESEGTFTGSATHTIRRTSPTTEIVGFYATYETPDGAGGATVQRVDAPWATVTWRSE